MNRISLSGIWNMTGGGFDVDGQIPGSLFSFLLDRGLMEDPFYRDNELSALALTHNDYSFKRSFNLSKKEVSYLLVFEGIDTLADIYLNGTHLAYVDDMHCRYEFSVGDILLDGENTLEVVCHEIHTLITKKHAELALDQSDHVLDGYGHIRKAHCMLGWDWGPYLPDMGIWRPVYLLEDTRGRIGELRITQRHDSGRVFLKLHAEVEGDYPCTLTLTAPSGKRTTLEADTEIEIDSPELWWPSGLGEQPLYTVSAETCLDFQEKRIGLREMKLIREKDRYGESFMHECSGVRFFAMGADYVPEDSIFSRITEQRTRRLLERCKAAGFNAIRIWGGGYYPDDFFFDICDELGIIVFSDMMFACSLYMPDERMIENIKNEIRQNLMRLRHHPSLALISGNNEVEACAVNERSEEQKRICIPVDIELFEGIIPDIVKEVCPEIPYISTSPITAGHFIDPDNENYGDSHYWKVWHGALPFSEYRKHYFRYLSEFGFQSFPSMKTLESFTLPEDRNIFSRIMEMHQRSEGANSKIIGYLSQNYLFPKDLDSLVYASQLLQAEAMKFAVEHLRRNRGRCMGALYWQLNDIWPVASWSAIDYYGRPKALYYYSKRFFSQVLLSCDEVGEKTTRPHVIIPPYVGYETTAQLSVTNDRPEPFSGTVKAKLKHKSGKLLSEYSFEVSLEPLSVIQLPKLDFDKTDVRNNYLVFCLESNGERVSGGAVIFTAPKHFDFDDPHLTARIEGDEIVITADSFAMGVALESIDSDAVFSDNFFDMEPGERRIKILEGKVERLNIKSVYSIAR